jgi:hypothetical protein
MMKTKENRKKSLYDENEIYSSVTEKEYIQRKSTLLNSIKILNKGEILTEINTRQSVKIYYLRNLFIK